MVEVNKAEEANGRTDWREAINGRKDEVEEGRVGRKGESLEKEDEVAEEIAVLGGRELEEADRPEYETRKRKLPADPCYPLKPK